MSTDVGIDVSKGYLDVCILASEETKQFRVTNDRKGLLSLIKALTEFDSVKVVAEATGGYQDLLVKTLQEAGIACVIMNPRCIRDFARASGILAKTDRIDAMVIAQFARRMTPETRALPSKEVSELRALVDRRAQIVQTLTQEKNRLQQETSPVVLKDICRSIKALTKRLTVLEKAISLAIDASESLKAKKNILCSVKGVATQTTATLLAYLPELGALSRRQIACLVGVAPLCRDSGAFKGKRTIWGGRAQVRCSLYMAVVSALRFNSQIKSFYARLRLAGKPARLAITACIRKLATILNAMIRDAKSWKH